mmetsp:Transcript_16087/g.14046  ORF Transcript_16087/g.14046 Transcript_16087/m.14046 type:complete len:80 (-) Transcript_16087:16-255(-)
MKERYEACIKDARNNANNIENLVSAIYDKSIKLDVYRTNQTMEKKIISSRLEQQKKYLRQQEAKEKELQQEYYRLTHKN